MLARIKLYHDFESAAEFQAQFAVPDSYMAACNYNLDILLDAWQAALTKLLQTTLQTGAASLLKSLENKADYVEMNVNLGSAAAIRKLNKEYRQKDYVTDVLSFPHYELKEGKLLQPLMPYDLEPEMPEEADVAEMSAEDEERMAPKEVFNLGDIYLCGDKVREQAENYGHSYWREFNFLCCHGFLHVLGYDHEEGQREESLQFALQDQILGNLLILRENPELKPAELIALAKEYNESPCLPLTAVPQAQTEDLPADFKSGFVAIVGRPNVGKSTLLNEISGAYLAITSAKAQTTRDNIRTIYNTKDSQIIFTDTPGVHTAADKLGDYMNQSGLEAIKDADAVLLLVDAAYAYPGKVEHKLLERLSELHKPAILVINKADTVVKQKLLPLIDAYSKLYPFQAVVPIAALKSDGIAELLTEIIRILPQGPRYYPLDYFTDQTERNLCAELIREQVLKYYHKELPYGVAVEIEKFAEETDETGERCLVKLQAAIITERASHKKMLIGKEGQAIKRMASSARIKIEEALECKVYLEVRVKVRENWRDKSIYLNDYGYNLKKAQNRPLQ